MRALFAVAASGRPPAAAVLFSTLGAEAGDAIVIPPGTTVLMDVSSPALSSLTVYGSLRSSGNADFQITAGAMSIESGGSFTLGAIGAPYTGQATVELNGARPTVSGNDGGGPLIVGLTHTINVPRGNNGTTNDNGGVSRGLMVKAGGTLKLFADLPAVHRARLNANAAKDTHTLVLDQAVQWKAGWKIAVMPTGLADNARRTEYLTIAADTAGGNIVATVEPLGTFKWGKLQYVTDAGMSLVPGTLTGAPAGAATTLDERAEVMLMTSNIKVQGANDSAWATYKFGAHAMFMGLSSRVYLDGVEFNRCGQMGLLGRYPIHWHVPSYNLATGETLGAYASGQAMARRCLVHHSGNRAVTLHGCRGVEVWDCNAHDILGHAYFLEDGSEELNVLDGNWVGKVSDPGDTYRIKSHDFMAAGFWITNWYNRIRNNRAADCQRGIWNAPSQDRDGFPGGCFGLSSQVPIHPYYREVLDYTDNSAHSCFFLGAITDDFVVDEQGTFTGSGKIQSTTDGQPGEDYGNLKQIPSVFTRTTLWKNGIIYGYYGASGGYQNRISDPRYVSWVQADNWGLDFQGATDAGICSAPLVVAQSLNVEANYTASVPAFEPTRQGFASYHGLLSFTNVLALGYSLNTPARAPSVYGLLRARSVMETWDNYTDPVFRYQVKNTGWKLIDCFGAYITPAPHIENPGYATWAINPVGTEDLGEPINLQRHWSIGLMYDPYGYLSGTANVYYMADHPYLKYGIATTPLADARLHAVTTPTPMLGMMMTQDDRGNQYSEVYDAITYQRVDADHADVAGAVWAIKSVGDFFGFRHAAVPTGGRVRYFNPSIAANAALIVIEVSNCRRLVTRGDVADDFAIIGLPWSGAVAPAVFATDNLREGNTYLPEAPAQGTARIYASVANKAALDASNARVFWRDTANDRLWVRVMACGADNKVVDPASTERISIVVKPA
jgi:hypothetical protein